MLSNGAYQLDFVNRLAFNRLAGSPEELAAVRLIQDEIAAMGGYVRSGGESWRSRTAA